ncbi:peptide/nickel transport system permease protein [Tindallia magadiensis]|uniref:Peptide/nickel transport system permease protein n=2 Tax=Tindallia magadiensis TaxID=69895 RepID=A0A1I3GR98_9FIRM|nr:peptide/nickel transport system permease protein [Tindallia magadiensis]
MMIFLLVLLMLAPAFAPHDPLKTNLDAVLQEPNQQFPLGTDHVGRCLLSRILHGAWITVFSSLSLLTTMLVTGLILGITASYCGGIVDQIIMRISDTVLAFPDIVFAIAVVGMLGPGLRNTLVALSIIWWTRYARLIRTLTARILSRDFIEAGIMTGANPLKIVSHYILPNLIPILTVQFVIDIGSVMLLIAGLSFIGLGVQAPLPEWGNMLNEGRPYIQTSPRLLFYPGMAIFFVVMVSNITGDLLRDKMDPGNASDLIGCNMYRKKTKRQFHTRKYIVGGGELRNMNQLEKRKLMETD